MRKDFLLLPEVSSLLPQVSSALPSKMIRILVPSKKKTNVFREWVQGLLAHDKKILVMGGCTLNSCVRVSSIDTIRFFKSHRLKVVVDLSISGARKSNFTASSEYGGLSSVEYAIGQMREADVHVVHHVTWR